MAIAKIQSRVKGHHHWYNYKYRVGEELECIRKPENKHSRHAVSVNTKEKEQKGQKGQQQKRQKREKTKDSDHGELKVIGHILDALAEVILSIDDAMENFKSDLSHRWKT